MLRNYRHTRRYGRYPARWRQRTPSISPVFVLVVMIGLGILALGRIF